MQNQSSPNLINLGAKCSPALAMPNFLIIDFCDVVHLFLLGKWYGVVVNVGQENCPARKFNDAKPMCVVAFLTL